MAQSINDIQNEIIEEFDFIGNDFENRVVYIMELGKKLDPLDEADRIDENIIKGCQSKVWLTARFNNGLVEYHADSNTDITKGLVSMLLRVINHQTPDDIVNADLYFIEKIGMNQVIGSQRSNGFTAMIKQAKLFAFALSSKQHS